MSFRPGVTTKNDTEPPKASFDSLVAKNVEAIARIEEAAHARRTRTDIISDSVARFCGSPGFVYVHLLLFGGWLLFNSLRAVPRSLHFDNPPFNELMLFVSLEAIFLSSFILISQNRQQRLADQRNHLDLQINLLAEQETSQMLSMMKQVMDHLGISSTHAHEVLVQETNAEQLAEQIGQRLNPGEELLPE